MGARIFFLIALIVIAIVGLAYSSVQSSAKKVVTVSSLLADARPHNYVRLGARLTGDDIVVKIDPSPSTEFSVVDPASPTTGQLKVRYDHPAPDSLKAGRDVILEGGYDGTLFSATTLLTQCPSKYEPPVPGGKSEEQKIK